MTLTFVFLLLKNDKTTVFYMESLSNWLVKCVLSVSAFITFIFECCYLPLVVFSKKKAISESLTVSQQLAMLEQMLSRQ